MNSPPASPPRFELGGASRVTGGILRGRAYGNVYNHADAETMFDLETRMGKVHVYMARVDPTSAKPDMVLKHKVTPKLKPILKALARGYSPVRSKLFFIFCIILVSFFFVDDNHRVFVYEDDMWTIKGRYDHALENDDDVSWTYENGQDVLRFLLVSFPWYVCLKLSSDANVQMDDEHRRRELSVPVTAISSTSGFSTRLSTPAVGTDVPVSVTHPTPSGEDSFAAGVLSQLGIPAHMGDRDDRGLHVCYEKYKAYLEACRVYERKVADGIWTGRKLTGTDLIQLFVSKSFWHSHYKPLFSKVSNHPDMVKWLEGHKDKPSDGVLWGYKRGTYQFKDLKSYLEENEKKKKGKGRSKDEKSEGSSKKRKDKLRV